MLNLKYVHKNNNSMNGFFDKYFSKASRSPMNMLNNTIINMRKMKSRTMVTVIQSISSPLEVPEKFSHSFLNLSDIV